MKLDLSIGLRLAAVALVVPPLALPSPAAAATCVVPAQRLVPAGSHPVFTFQGISTSFRGAFLAAAAQEAAVTGTTGGRPYPVSVSACQLHNGFHGMTGHSGGGARVCIDTVYAGGNWINQSVVHDPQGDTFHPLILAWHEMGHVYGLQHPGAGPESRPNLAGSTIMFPEMADNGSPGSFGAADIAALRRAYSGAGAPASPPSSGGGSGATPGTGSGAAPGGTASVPPAPVVAAPGSTSVPPAPAGGTAVPRPASPEAVTSAVSPEALTSAVSPKAVTSAAAARPGPPEPSRDACRRIAGNRGWTGVATEGRGPAAADGRGSVEVTGERDGEGRERACRYDAGSGRARFDDQE